MRLDPTLTSASRLARSGKYEAALRILLPQVTRYGRSFRYYYLLGTVCLHAGDFGGALTYLRLAREVNGRDPSTILGLAALYIRRGDISGAIDMYLEVLELDHKNAIAQKAMRIIRRQAGTDAFSVWIETGKLPSLYPPIPFPGFAAKEMLGICGVLVVVCAICFGVLVQTGFVRSPFMRHGPRDISELALAREDRRAPIVDGGTHRYPLSQSEAVRTYDRALALFSNHRDEAARIYLNRIIGSNASEGIQNRARRMISQLETPGFDTFRRGDNVSYIQVRRNPQQYRGVHVIWRGVASNFEEAERSSFFELLIGYDSPRIVEGTVPVGFGHAIPVPEGAIEVLGRIVLIDDDRIRLEGVAIRINL